MKLNSNRYSRQVTNVSKRNSLAFNPSECCSETVEDVVDVQVPVDPWGKVADARFENNKIFSCFARMSEPKLSRVTLVPGSGTRGVRFGISDPKKGPLRTLI